MIDVAVSQLTTPRWDLGQELDRMVACGFDAVSLWRPKITDAGLGHVAARLACAGVRVSSLQWTGGFTGGDGRSYRECVDDAVEAHPGVTNVGVRPTVDGRRLSIETHLLDFTGDLYGRTLRIDVVARIREERRFDGLDALVAQIRADADAARGLLA